MPDSNDPNLNPAIIDSSENSTESTSESDNSSVNTNDMSSNSTNLPSNTSSEHTPSTPNPPTNKNHEAATSPTSSDTGVNNQMPATNASIPTVDQPVSQNSESPSVVTNSSNGSNSSGKVKRFVLPVLGVLLLVLSVGTGVVLVRQNQDIEEEAFENCVPPVAGEREWWSIEILNEKNRPNSDTGQITGLEPGTHEVIIEAWSDSAFGCGSNQQDETAEVQVNGQTVTVTDTNVPGSTTVQVEIGQDGILNITATALGNPGSMFVFVRVPEDEPVACEIPPADGRLILNFEDENSLLQSIQDAQALNINTEGSSYRVLIQIINAEGNKEFFVVLIDNQQDSVFITRTNSITNLPDDLSAYEELSDDNITLGPDMSSLEALINSYTGQDPQSISIICASFEEYDLQASPTPTQPVGDAEIFCSQVQVYDEDWNQLSSSQLSALSAGDIVRFAVSGTASSGTIDKARFKINSQDWVESTSTTPGETTTFYTEYTIPSGVDRFDIAGQVHHVQTNTWY